MTYYKVTAIIGSVESIKSIEVSATPAAAELFTVESSWSTVTPSIDGQISSGERNALDHAGQKVTSCIYIYHLKAGDFSTSKKMIIMK